VQIIMQVALNKQSDVPLHQQLAEQLVFLITTRKLQAGEQLPSVRTFARQLGIHHNTVSKSYHDLVGRGWLKRQRGSRLCVQSAPSSRKHASLVDLDELINQTIRRASELGYSLQELRSQALERLRAQPPDHILVIEHEPELRQVICAEIRSKIGERVESCTEDELSASPELALGSQVVAPERRVHAINPLLSSKLPCIALAFASAQEHLELIRGLTKPSTIGVASISKTFLKIARSLLATVVGRRHVMEMFLLSPDRRMALDGMDLIFCDAVTMPLVRGRRKIQYRVISEKCLEDIAVSLKPPIPPES
jgi:DNA-binding transcriptional regulator YhcF (GntR family)